jgi:RNA polymerase sigma-70 factor, ECF subfamily
MKSNNTEKIIRDLFNEYFHSLVFKSFKIVKDYDLAKDIVQDVFVKVWQNYDQIKHVRNLKSYLFKAVQNSSLNYLRDQKNNKVSVVDLNIDHQAEVDEIDNKEEIFKQIHQAIDKLPDKWRTAYILSRHEKLKYHEIAEKMNISIKTVEKYISKALNFIRLELKPYLSVFFLIFFTK